MLGAPCTVGACGAEAKGSVVAEGCVPASAELGVLSRGVRGFRAAAACSVLAAVVLPPAGKWVGRCFHLRLEKGQSKGGELKGGEGDKQRKGRAQRETVLLHSLTGTAGEVAGHGEQAGGEGKGE